DRDHLPDHRESARRRPRPLRRLVLHRPLSHARRLPSGQSGLRELFRETGRPLLLGMALSYDSAGVDYDRLDAFKRACQRAAAQTVPLLAPHGYREPEGIRGDSSYLIEGPNDYLAHVEEGLGTKNLVADAMEQATGRTFYHGIGVDTVATIVNDL